MSSVTRVSKSTRIVEKTTTKRRTTKGNGSPKSTRPAAKTSAEAPQAAPAKAFVEVVTDMCELCKRATRGKCPGWVNLEERWAIERRRLAELANKEKAEYEKRFGGPPKNAKDATVECERCWLSLPPADMRDHERKHEKIEDCKVVVGAVQPYLGMFVQSTDNNLTGKIYVGDVVRKGPADLAGFRKGDRIRRWGPKRIRAPEEFDRAFHKYCVPGAVLSIDVEHVNEMKETLVLSIQAEGMTMEEYEKLKQIPIQLEEDLAKEREDQERRRMLGKKRKDIEARQRAENLELEQKLASRRAELRIKGQMDKERVEGANHHSRAIVNQKLEAEGKSDDAEKYGRSTFSEMRTRGEEWEGERADQAATGRRTKAEMLMEDNRVLEIMERKSLREKHTHDELMLDRLAERPFFVGEPRVTCVDCHVAYPVDSYGAHKRAHDLDNKVKDNLANVQPSTGLTIYTTDHSCGGAKIHTVEKGKSAHRAGLKPKDIIVEMGTKPVDSPEDYAALLPRLLPNQVVVMTVIRHHGTGPRESVPLHVSTDSGIPQYEAWQAAVAAFEKEIGDARLEQDHQLRYLREHERFEDALEADRSEKESTVLAQHLELEERFSSEVERSENTLQSEDEAAETRWLAERLKYDLPACQEGVALEKKFQLEREGKVPPARPGAASVLLEGEEHNVFCKECHLAYPAASIEGHRQRHLDLDDAQVRLAGAKPNIGLSVSTTQCRDCGLQMAPEQTSAHAKEHAKIKEMRKSIEHLKLEPIGLQCANKKACPKCQVLFSAGTLAEHQARHAEIDDARKRLAATKPMVGIHVEVNDDGDGGCDVGAVNPNQPAEAAGIVQSDVIFSWGGIPVDGPAAFRKAFAKVCKPGAIIMVEVRGDDGKGELRKCRLIVGSKGMDMEEFNHLQGLVEEFDYTIPRLLEEQKNGKDSSGVEVVGVEAGSPAERAGIVVGDHIVAWDKHPTSRKREIDSGMARAMTHAPGTTVEVGVVSAGQHDARAVVIAPGCQGMSQGEYQSLVQSIEKFESANKAQLKAQAKRKGVSVTSVEDASPAKVAGLSAGDRIGSVGGERVTDEASYYSIMERLAKPGASVEVMIRRAGSKTTEVVTIVVGASGISPEEYARLCTVGPDLEAEIAEARKQKELNDAKRAEVMRKQEEEREAVMADYEQKKKAYDADLRDWEARKAAAIAGWNAQQRDRRALLDERIADDRGSRRRRHTDARDAIEERRQVARQALDEESKAALDAFQGEQDRKRAAWEEDDLAHREAYEQEVVQRAKRKASPTKTTGGASVERQPRTVKDLSSVVLRVPPTSRQASPPKSPNRPRSTKNTSLNSSLNSSTLSRTMTSPRSSSEALRVFNIREVSLDPLDFGHYQLTSLSDALSLPPRAGVIKPLQNDALNQSMSGPVVAVRFRDNKLTSLDGLQDILEHVLDFPERVQWLDFSNNQLTFIDARLALYPQLNTLHLEENPITDIREIYVLSKLRNLITLTLDGAIEDHPMFRNYVITCCPHLRNLNHAVVTPTDRLKAKAWRDAYISLNPHACF